MASSDFQRTRSHDSRRCRSQDSAECAGSAFSLSPRDLLPPQRSPSAHFPHPSHVPRSPLPRLANPTPRSQSCPIDQSDPVYAQHIALTRSASAAALPHSGVELSRRADFPCGATAAALPLPPLECASAQAAAGFSWSADTTRGGVCATQATRSRSSPSLSPAVSGRGSGSGSDGACSDAHACGENPRSLRQSARTFDPSVLPRLSQRRARTSFDAEHTSLAENFSPSPVVLFNGRPASPAFALPPPPLAESPAVSAPNTPYPPNTPHAPSTPIGAVAAARRALAEEIPAFARVSCEVRPPTPRPPTPRGNVAIRS